MNENSIKLYKNNTIGQRANFNLKQLLYSGINEVLLFYSDPSLQTLHTHQVKYSSIIPLKMETAFQF